MQITRRNMIRWMGFAGGAFLGLPLAHADSGPANLLGLAATLGEITAEPALTRWQRRAAERRELARDIVWLTHEPLEFLIRRGDHFDDEAEQYRRMCEPANLQRMAAAGVRYGRIFFYKGFGVEYERPNIEKAKAVADVLHQSGMKVSLYMAGTMFTETLYHEIPQARDWEQRDQNNHWVSYGIQTFRHYACPNEPAYREYLKRILKIGITELHADEIAFDNIMLMAEPHSCRCPRCMKAFAEFLRAKYPTEAAVRRRFGLPSVDSIEVNQWETPEQPASLAVLDDPVLQEWTRFRCESLASYARDLYDYVKSVNPAVAVLFNIKGVYSYNRYWTNAVYQPLFAGHIDLLAFDTGGYDEHIDATTGALISQIRSYKLARQLKTSCEDSLRDDLRAAVHMAFGYQKPGTVAAPMGSGAHNAFTPLLEFFREYNDRYYTQTENVADVAVLRNWPSMAYSISATSVPATLMEQVLIQHQVAWDLLFDEQIDHIGKYAAVILAGQECVSDAQVKALLDYVRKGGTLLLTGNTAQFNDWREKRRANPLLPARKEGAGQIIYIPEIIRADKKPAKTSAAAPDAEPGPAAMKNPPMTPPQWVLPQNHREIHRAIIDGLPAGPSISADAPLTTVMELLNRPTTRETIVHFVNFDRENTTAAFKVSLRKQFPGSVKSILCFSPETDESATIAFEETAANLTFTAPAIKLYAMLVIAHNS